MLLLIFIIISKSPQFALMHKFINFITQEPNIIYTIYFINTLYIN